MTDEGGAIRRFTRSIRPRRRAVDDPGDQGQDRREARRAERLVEAGLVDVEWYVVQSPATDPRPTAVALDYVRHGWREGLTPHPLVLRAWAGKGSADGLLNVPTLLERAGTARPLHPLFDPVRYLAAHPAAAEHPGGPLGHFLSSTDPDRVLPAHEPEARVPWGRARELLVGALRARRDAAAAPDRSPVGTSRVRGRVSVLVAATSDWLSAVRVVTRLRETAGASDLEVVVLDSGGNQVVAGMLAVLLTDLPGVRVVHLASPDPPAVARHDLLAHSTGEYVLLLDPSVRLPPQWQPLLVQALASEGAGAVAPLLLGPDGAIAGAGVVFDDRGRPERFLAGHPREDAARRGTFAVPALTTDCVMVRADDLLGVLGSAAQVGVDAGGLELCLRVTERTGDQARVVASVAAVRASVESARLDLVDPDGFRLRWPGIEAASREAWSSVGFEVAYRPGRRVRGVRTDADRLRWAIKVAAPAGPVGDGWGDVYYAASLAAALERLGQAVAIDRREAHHRPTWELDDVTLVLRGLERFDVQPGRVNLLWVISHPDLVGADELRTYDHVFSAGPRWAREVTAETGIEVTDLLQATDPQLFNPDRAEPDTGHRAVFVGSSRNVRRRIVQDAVDVGLEPAVFGPHWELFYPGAAFLHDPVPNTEVGRLYRSAGVVLNDHWDDMAAHGFVSNRLFDAVACGARVVSDPVEGIGELFEGTVLVYTDRRDLADLVAGDLRDRFPDDARRVRLARRVGREHSFDARAAVLLETALRLRGAGGVAG